MQFNILRSNLRLLFACACSASLAACSGSNGSNSYNPPYNGGGSGYNQACNPGTSVQLANPLPQAFNVPTNVGTLTIVANGNTNPLYQSYNAWSIVLQGYYNPINGGQLSLVPNQNGPHPYPSDFYCSSSLPTLPIGQNFSVGLVNNSAFCSPVIVGTFST